MKKVDGCLRRKDKGGVVPFPALARIVGLFPNNQYEISNARFLCMLPGKSVELLALQPLSREY